MITNVKKNWVVLCVLSPLLVALISCVSPINKEIKQTENPTVKLLKIRELTFQKRYRLAERQYKIVQSEYPEDKNLQTTIDYEIAFLYIKRKKYEKARPMFQSIVDRYDLDENSAKLVQWPYYLSQKMISNIDVELAKPTYLQKLIPARWKKEPQ